MAVCWTSSTLDDSAEMILTITGSQAARKAVPSSTNDEAGEYAESLKRGITRQEKLWIQEAPTEDVHRGRRQLYVNALSLVSGGWGQPGTESSLVGGRGDGRPPGRKKIWVRFILIPDVLKNHFGNAALFCYKRRCS